MKLFKGFDAVRFPEENLIFVTHDGYLYYIYNLKYKHWRKHRNAGNDQITVRNYEDVSKEEIMGAMGGVFPKSETDFMRFCDPSQLCIRDMLDLFREDYPRYMSDREIVHTVHRFLLDSVICHKSYEKLRTLLDSALEKNAANDRVLSQIKDLSFTVIGRDIFKKEIEIVDGHDDGSCFWIMPVRVVDWSDTNETDAVAEMRSVEISIEEDDVSQYLTPFLYKYFDAELEANKRRLFSCWSDGDGIGQSTSGIGFEWNLTHNFFTFDSMTKIIRDISDTVDALSSGRENEYTAELIKKRRGISAYELLDTLEFTGEQIQEQNDHWSKEDDAVIEMMVDFYRRLLYRLEYMMKVGKEKGYDLISFMGP